jgi:hypothetical protein
MRTTADPKIVTVDEIFDTNWVITESDRYYEEDPETGRTTGVIGVLTLSAKPGGVPATITVRMIDNGYKTKIELDNVQVGDALVIGDEGDDLDYTLKEFLTDNYEYLPLTGNDVPFTLSDREASAEQLQRGQVLQSLEGVDVGSGALVVDVEEKDDGTYVELFFLDDEMIKTIKLGDGFTFVEEEKPEQEFNTKMYDPTALDSPCLHDIRTLPTYWGPRDPNNPSFLTDVTWRPEPYNRRWMNRYYQVNAMISYKGHHYAVVSNRMKLDQWHDKCADLSNEELLVLATQFVEGYDGRRKTYIPGRGNRENLEPHDYALMFAPDHNLTDRGMDCLWRFMVAVEAMPAGEYKLWQDDISSYEVYRRDRQL